MKQKMLKRMLCGLLACVLVLGYIPVPAHAAQIDGLCPHHTQHTPECGYSAGAAGSPCTHVCDAGCYQTVTQCTHVHGDCGYAEGAAESVCTHVCSVESGCVVVIPDCHHVHDDSCGYAAEIPESPCAYQCAECQQAAVDQAAADAVAAVIAELPTVEELKAMTAEEQQAVYNRLQAALNAYNALTIDQKALIPNAEAVLLPLLEYFDSLDSTGNQGAGSAADVEAVQALIDDLPTLEEVQAMPMEEQLEAYNQVQSVYAVYDALPDEQKAKLTNAEETFGPLFDYFNSLVAAAWDGTGTASSPYLINNEDDLRALAQSTYDGNAQTNTYFALTGNITLTETWTPIGTEATKFCGIFNGQGYTISGISGTGSYLGLFAYLGGGAQVENVNVASVNLSGGPYLAGIAAVADHTSGQIVIRNCHALSGTITGIDSDDAWIRDLAGIVGYAHGGIGITIERCTNSVYINAGNNVTWAGGIAGELTRATVTSCINYANVSGNAYSEENGSSYLGGISGEASGSTFTGCANYGQISTFFAAGIAGGSGNRYSNCLNGGTLTHSSDGYGDPIGRISNNRFDNCYFSKDGYEGGMLWNDPSKTGTKVGSLSDGSVAYDMGNYFGQVIGTDPYPVLLTSANQVHKVTITGEIAETLYVTHNRQMNLTLEDANLKLFLNDSEFDISTPITGDISLTARVERTIVASGTCGAEGDNLTWVLTDDGVLTISGTGAMAYYAHPDYVPWNDYRGTITALNLTTGITSIGDWAFYDCSGLTSLSIPDSVTSIGKYAFGHCTGLTSLTVPEGIVSIGACAFYGCSGLTSVSIPTSVTSIGSDAFTDCSGLESATYAGTMEQWRNIRWYFPAVCVDGTLLNYGNCGADGDNLTYTLTGDGVLTITGSGEMMDYVSNSMPWYKYQSSITSILFSGDITSIGNYAFYDCTSVSSVTIPDSVTSLGAHCFACCSGLKAVTLSKNITSYGYWAFTECTGLSEITIPEGIETVGYGCFYKCTSLASVTLPNSLTSIGSGAFRYCSSLSSVTIPQNVTSIDPYAFSDCTDLKTVYFQGNGITGYSNIFNNAVTAYYPKGNTTWNSSIRNSYGGSVTWVEMACTGGETHTVVTDSAKAATCTETGLTEGSHCSVCGEILTAQEEIPAKGHTEVIDAAVTPTCTETGLTEGKHCSVCNEVLVAQEVVPAKGHTEVIDAAVAPTCTETGLTEGKHCSVCNEVLAAQEIVPATGHTEVIDVAVAPTCTETGLTEGKHCSVCNEVLVAQTVVPAKGHTEVIDAAVAPTCTETGLTEGKHCSVCNEVLVAQTVVPATGHTEVIDAAVAPTCTETGLTEGKHCSVCNEVLVAQTVVPAKGHTEETIPGKAATCTETGLTDGVKCSVCDKILVAQTVVSRKAHTEEIDPAVEATCTEPGLTEGKHCSVCGVTLVGQNSVPAKGHTVVIDEAVEATCTETGLTEGKHCSVCDKILAEQTEVPAKGHTEVVDEAVEATCTETGLTEGKHCSVCDEVLAAQEEVPALSHDWGEWTVSVPAAPEAEGEEIRTCSRCEEEETRPLAYTGHRLELTGTGLENESVVWIDGAPCYVQKDASGKPYLILPEHCTPILVTYSFNTGSGDRHAQYPTGMQVYRIVTTESGMTVEHIPELDNLLQYSGSSIRITGKKGIRMITSINQATRNALTGSGLAGFTLLEYGTALCRSSVLEGGAPLVLETAGVKSNYAYLKDVADPVFKYTGGLIQYTNVLVGFTDEDCKEDIAMRPYIKLQDESGEVVTIYGGTVYRSIGYIAYQNRNAFKTGSEAYNYVWNIIHYVYGDQYDADYKG